VTWLWRWIRTGCRSVGRWRRSFSDSDHPDDLFQSQYVTPGFKPFSYKRVICTYYKMLCNGKHSHLSCCSNFILYHFRTRYNGTLISVLKDSYCEFLIHFALQLGYKPNATVLKNYLYGRRDCATPNTLRWNAKIKHRFARRRMAKFLKLALIYPR